MGVNEKKIREFLNEAFVDADGNLQAFQSQEEDIRDFLVQWNMVYGDMADGDEVDGFDAVGDEQGVTWYGDDYFIKVIYDVDKDHELSLFFSLFKDDEDDIDVIDERSLKAPQHFIDSSGPDEPYSFLIEKLGVYIDWARNKGLFLGLNEDVKKLVRESVLKSMFENIARCNECGWSWEKEPKDDNPDLCHKCGYDSGKGEYDMGEWNKWKLVSELEEAYPTSFNMEDFKALTSFAARVRYCDEHLGKPLGSGTARRVYKIDDEKVLKLAKNSKGIAQNEEEERWGNDHYFKDILAQTFEYHPQYHWVEMELARPARKADFKAIEGIPMDVFFYGVSFYGEQAFGRGYQRFTARGLENLGAEYGMTEDDIWENSLLSSMNDFVHAKGTAGDLDRKSTYGVVKRNGEENIVIVDYGLSDDVYNTYYGRS